MVAGEAVGNVAPVPPLARPNPKLLARGFGESSKIGLSIPKRNTGLSASEEGYAGLGIDKSTSQAKPLRAKPHAIRSGASCHPARAGFGAAPQRN